MKKQEKGITLVALIITIVVLLILAVVTVGAVQENGIIDKAQSSSQRYKEEKLREEVKMKLLESSLDENVVTATMEDTIVKLYNAAYEVTKDSQMSKTFALAYLNTDPEQNTFKDGGVVPIEVVTTEGETLIVYEINYSPDGGNYVMDKDFVVYKIVNNSLYRASDGEQYSVATYEVAISSNDKYLYLESIDGSYICIWYYKGSDTIVDVAKDFRGKTVTKVASYGFASLIEDENGMPTLQGKDDTTVKEIILPDTIVEFDGFGFFNRSSLEKVKLSKNMTNIPQSCFRYCYSLSSIEIPEKVTQIGSWAFDGCRLLESINIPSSVTSIASDAFVRSGITTININKAKDSIPGAPWYAPDGVTINWLGE